LSDKKIYFFIVWCVIALKIWIDCWEDWGKSMCRQAFFEQLAFGMLASGSREESCLEFSFTLTIKRCWMFRLLVFPSILTKWCSSTRLETRTKESNIYASIWVINPLKMRNESEGEEGNLFLFLLRWDPFFSFLQLNWCRKKDKGCTIGRLSTCRRFEQEHIY